MEVTAKDVARIPRGNIHVPWAEFVDVWARAEQLSGGSGSQAMGGFYSAGVAITCRWLATAIVRREDGPWERAPGPATGRTSAHEEIIGDEAVAIEAKLFAAAQDGPDLTPATAALMGMVAGFKWAWWRTAPAPFDSRQQTG